MNEEQQKAVDTLEGPLIVLAGPGTGKTELLSVRTANILKQTDLYPSNILILTYTNAGVKAMRERLAKLIGPNGYEVVVDTFHGFANTVITESEESFTLKGERIQMTDLERIHLLEYLIDHTEGISGLRNPNAPYLYRSEIEKNISILKKDGITPKVFEKFLKTHQSPDEKIFRRLKAFSRLYDAYEAAKLPDSRIPCLDKRGRYDFDDMIIMALQILESEPDLLARMQEQFQYLMVDEFQDTNGAQLKLLFTLFPDPLSNVCVVGDDDQAIYRFQGANIKNFKDFEAAYPSAEKILLKKNYRSYVPILEYSNRLIRQIGSENRILEKHLEAVRGPGGAVSSFRFGSLEEELHFILSRIKNMNSSEWNETTILVRTRKEASLVIEAFLQTGIPYTTDGKEDIRGEFRVQQLLKILKLSETTLNSEEKDILLFEILLSDFWNIAHEDLLQFVNSVNQKKISYRKKLKRRTTKSDRDYLQESRQEQMDFSVSSAETDSKIAPSLLTELFLRFPLPERPAEIETMPPLMEETEKLSILTEQHFRNPGALHRASFALFRFCTRASNTPAYTLVLELLRDSGLTDYILSSYEHNEVLRLRELRALSSVVNNLKKGNHARPGLLLHEYRKDLEALEKHEIALQGEMVSRNQEGVKILTAHGSKGLEFRYVFIPFCIQDSSWPKKERSSLIPLPEQLLGYFSTEKNERKKLHEADELRLLYVAATRARDELIFTASSSERQIVSKFLTAADLAPSLNSIKEEDLLIRFLKHIPHPDPVEHSRETLAGLVEEISLSPSSLNRYLTCPRQFLYHHLLRSPEPKKTSLVYGQCVHKALEKSFRRFIKEGQLPDLNYFKDQFLLELEWQGVDKAMHQSCVTKFEYAKKWYEMMRETGATKPLELERKLIRKMPEGLIFEGKFDKVEPLGSSGEVQIVDYKTGEPDKHIKALEKVTDIFSPDCDDYLRQLIAYKMLYESGYRRRRVKNGQLVFLDPVKTSVKKYGLEEGTFINKTIPLTEEMVRNFEQLLLATWRKIKALEFQRLLEFDEKKCGYCPYQGVCWKK